MQVFIVPFVWETKSQYDEINWISVLHQSGSRQSKRSDHFHFAFLRLSKRNSNFFRAEPDKNTDEWLSWVFVLFCGHLSSQLLLYKRSDGRTLLLGFSRMYLEIWSISIVLSLPTHISFYVHELNFSHGSTVSRAVSYFILNLIEMNSQGPSCERSLFESINVICSQREQFLVEWTNDTPVWRMRIGVDIWVDSVRNEMMSGKESNKNMQSWQ